MIFSSFQKIFILLMVFANIAVGSPSENQTTNIVVKEAWIRPSRLENSAAYMVIENKGSRLDCLIIAETTACEHVELHRIEEVNGVFFMKEVKTIDIPAGSSTILKPSGMHIMLMKLRRAMKVGEKVDLKLVFQNAGAIDLKVDIRLKNNPERMLKDHESEELNLNTPVLSKEEKANESAIKKL